MRPHSNDMSFLKFLEKSIAFKRLYRHLVAPLENASTLAFWATEMRGAGVSLMEKLSELEASRQPSNGTRHDFREILVIAVCAMLSDANRFEDIALWGRLKADWLRRFLLLQNDTPSQDTFLRVFRVINRRRGISNRGDPDAGQRLLPGVSSG